MAKVKIQGNASGTGVLTLTAPNTSTDRTITLPDEDVTLGAATPSIVDNGNATAITIDSSENVLVGKTTSDTGNSLGFEARQNGLVNIGRDGGEPLLLNRNTSDGDIVAFRKDGTTKGSIGVTSSGAYITLGGTGAANTLDDYEEGTFTPTFNIETGANFSVSSAAGSYTKVGRVVYFTAEITFNKTGGSNNVWISGLPFTSTNDSREHKVIWQQGKYNGGGNYSYGGTVSAASTVCYFVDSANNGSTNFDTNNGARINNVNSILTMITGFYTAA